MPNTYQSLKDSLDIQIKALESIKESTVSEVIVELKKLSNELRKLSEYTDATEERLKDFENKHSH